MGTEGARHRCIVGVLKRGADDAAAVIDLLVIALDVPGGIVGDNEHGLGAMPDGGVDLHGINAVGAVAVDGDDLLVRVRQGCGNSKWDTYAQTANDIPA